MGAKILQLKITLNGIRPPIWRRVLVKDNQTFYHLHQVIQAAMGWESYHLYEFNVFGNIVADEAIPPKSIKLARAEFEPKDEFNYVYDFGDDWLHEIVVEKILEPEKGQKYPVCIKGERNCPPEDVGGIWGYGEFLEVIADSNHSEYEEMLEWVGGEFDPEEFELEIINKRLASI